MRKSSAATPTLWFDYESDEKAREAEKMLVSTVMKSSHDSKRKYEDISFYGGKALYKDPHSPPNGFPHADDVEWGRLCVPNDISSVKYPTSLFIEGSEPGDVIQGVLGNCWFVSAMSLISTKELLLRRLFVSSRYASIGLYTLKFFKHGTWKYVHIDDRLPLNAARNPKYTHCKNASETWAMLLEKAYAKMHGCYEVLTSGWIDYGLRDLTGGAPMKMKFKDKRYARMLLRNNGVEMFELMRRSHESGALLGTSFNTNESDEMGHRDSGILKGHAYGILRIVKRNVKHENEEDETLRLLQLRNPWGMKEWTGDFSDGDTIWDEYPEIKRELVGKNGFSNDGVFWMTWYDFMREFNQVFVCESRDHKTWHGTRFEGAWDKRIPTSCPGGCPLYKASFPSNPQYAFQVDEPTSIEIVVFQRDIRWLDRVTTYKYGVGFVLMKLRSSTRLRITKFSSRDQVGKSRSFVMDRHVYTKLPQKLSSGRYVIIPCSYRPDELNETEYGLEVYTDRPVRWFQKDGMALDNNNTLDDDDDDDDFDDENDDKEEREDYVMEKRSEPEPEQRGRALAAMQRELMSLSKEVNSMRKMIDYMEQRLEAKLNGGAVS